MRYLPHEQRVIEERDEVQARLEKLVPFMETDKFKSLHPLEQDRLLRQSYIMYLYLDVLAERINAFEGDEP